MAIWKRILGTKRTFGLKQVGCSTKSWPRKVENTFCGRGSAAETAPRRDNYLFRLNEDVYHARSQVYQLARICQGAGGIQVHAWGSERPILFDQVGGPSFERRPRFFFFFWGAREALVSYRGVLTMELHEANLPSLSEKWVRWVPCLTTSHI